MEADTQARQERVTRRIAGLRANDPQFRDAEALEAVARAVRRPGLSLSQIMAAALEGYADRPALGQRARELVTDAATGRESHRLLPRFDTLSYRELWLRVRALAGAWQHDAAHRVAAGDRVCSIGSPGIDHAIIDLACLHAGAVIVPLQTSAPIPQQLHILDETQPRVLATNMDCLGTAVEFVVSSATAPAVVVFDYHPEDDRERLRFEAARLRLSQAPRPVGIESLQALIERGRSLPPARLFVPAPGDDPLLTVIYTSGSTGSPKGAMYTERMLTSPWMNPAVVPLICLNYMPLNHSFGRSWMALILGNGGTCFFTARGDLSLLFEDIGMVRPTMMNLVPRICEMLWHQYQSVLVRRTDGGSDPDTLASAAMAEVRQQFLGGRILSATVGAAPIPPEMHAFIEACLDVKLNNGYGTTETGAITFNAQVMRPPVTGYKLVDVPELGYFSTDKPHPRGELLVKSQTLMPGYYKRPEVTAAMFDAQGFYRTGDIMAEIGPDRLIYVDRRNNVLKLAQGEFVAIARLEAVFSSGNPLIHQIYLYGTSERAYLLAVVVPNPDAVHPRTHGADAQEVKSRLRDAMQAIAKGRGLNAYELPRDFLVETEPFSVENGLLTPVGKFRRPGLKERYGARLEQLYADMAQDQTDELRALRQDRGDRPVFDTVVRAAQATLGVSGIDTNASLSFADLGGDSLSALSFSMLLEEIFGIEVPVGTVISPTSDLRKLARYIQTECAAASDRPTFASVHGRGRTEVHARELTLARFIDAPTLAEAKTLARPSGAVKTVLLTGANGFLGRFLCVEWLERLAKVGGRLICIARGENPGAARQRIDEAFDSGDAVLSQHVAELAAEHLEVLAGDIGAPNLGLDDATWNRLADSVDLIVHPAALVNHLLPYSQMFGPNVVGTAELIRLALTWRLKPFNYVSTVAAALLGDGAVVSEEADIRFASPVRAIDQRYAGGYATSKWAGEVLLREAHDLCGLPVTVFRSDMILAHSRYAGQLNVPDMFTRLLFSLAATGVAPRSFYVTDSGGARARAHYDGLPVDFTAEAIATLGAQAASGFRTYHVLNPHDDDVSLDQFVDWLIEAGHPIQRVDRYDDWLARFEAGMRALPEKQRQHCVLALLDAFRHPAKAIRGSSVPAERFHAGVRAAAIGPDGDIPRLTAAFIRKYMADLRRLQLV